MDVKTPGAALAVPRTVLFDFDGVLVHGDSFESFLRSRLRRAPWRWPLLVPVLPFMPLLLRSPRGKGLLARLLLRVVTLGWSEPRYRRIAADFGRRFAQRPGVFLRDGIHALRCHLAAGDRVLIVSATEITLLDAILDTIALTGVERIASRVRSGRFGLRADPHNYGAVKVRQLVAHGIAAPWDRAYSDALPDLPLLAGARRAVLVNPDARTERVLRRALGERLEVVGWS